VLLLAAAFGICAGCHQQIVERWSKSPMARTSGVALAAEQPPGGAGPGFRVTSDSSLKLCYGAIIQRLDYYIGSGRMGRSYVFVDQGYMYQAPVGYYATRRRWDLAPGYERDPKPDFTRPVTLECLFCHASGARAAPETLNRILNPDSLSGISCERCHGDAAAHLADPRRGNIVNPALLPAALRDSICEQCHLAGRVRMALPGKSLVDFRPGALLSDFIEVFVGGDKALRVNGHAEALSASRCKAASGDRLWCGTCHVLHAPTQTDYNAKCRACHRAAQCQRATAARAFDCVGCHMPKTRAVDGGHTVWTDHSIPRRARGQTPVASPDMRPYYRRPLPRALAERNLGLAYAELAEQTRDLRLLTRAWPLLRNAIDAGVQDPVLYARAGGLMQADGRREQAIALYRASVAMDPAQPDVLFKLAGLLQKAGAIEDARRLLEKARFACPRAVMTR
jgi:hypothetical protein